MPAIVFATLVGWLWFRVVWHYHVPRLAVSAGAVELARSSPPEQVFDSLRTLHTVEDSWNDPVEVVPAANRLLRGETIQFHGEELSLRLALSPRKMARAPTATMLGLACMDAVDLLVGAYRATRNVAYLASARDIVLAFDSWDSAAWVPLGLAWNDHAVSARAQVLSDFWGVYRQSAIYNAADARRILQSVARLGRRLGEDRFFLAGTNHGLMQNIALLELAIAFPSLPDSGTYRQLAIRRLETQLSFIVSDEGVVLEHSAYYHYFGMRQMSIAWRLMRMLRQPVPRAWQKNYELAARFYGQLQRPDGTLPQFGDTYSGPNSFTPGIADAPPPSPPVPSEAWAVYPVSGYAVSWSGLERWPASDALSETVVTWSNFPSHSHKHADDLGLLVWSGGQSWWTSVGYWPYGDGGRRASESWTSSNAPHLENEPFPTSSPGRLLAVGSSGALRFLDLERDLERNTGTKLRRQVLELQPGQWAVIDSSGPGTAQRVVTAWNTEQSITVKDASNGCYRLTAAGSTRAMDTCVTAGSPLKAEWKRGSTRPFAGWQVIDFTPRPANALLLQQAAGSWSVNAFHLVSTTAPSSTPPKMRFQDARHWTLTLGDGNVVSREEASVKWSASQGRKLSLTLAGPPSDAPARIERLRQAYFSAMRQYPPFENAYGTRRKVTLLLCAAFAVSIMVLLIVRRPRWSAVGHDAVPALAALWVFGGIAVLVNFSALF